LEFIKINDKKYLQNKKKGQCRVTNNFRVSPKIQVKNHRELLA
jgi:hypothetical protein